MWLMMGAISIALEYDSDGKIDSRWTTVSEPLLQICKWDLPYKRLIDAFGGCRCSSAASSVVSP